MVSLLVYEFYCANVCTVMYQNFVSLPILFWVFPVASLKSKLSLSHELAPFLRGHGGNICRYTKPAFILITFTCSNSLRDARVHIVWCSIFILNLTNSLWMVFKSNWFFFPMLRCGLVMALHPLESESVHQEALVSFNANVLCKWRE